MGEINEACTSRRKRIHNDGCSTVKTNGQHVGNGANNEFSKHCVASFADEPSYSSSTRAADGKVRSRMRRKRSEQRRRKKSRPFTLGVYIAVCLLIGFAIVIWTDPSISNSSMSQDTASSSIHSSNRGHDASNNSNANTGKGYERILSKIPNNNSPLTEEQEHEILQAANDELNQFPISVGTHDDGQNPNWETIQHPGTEALDFFNKNSPKRKKRATASEIAGVLSGKKLRGTSIANHVNGDGDGSDSSIEEGYMRVPKFWDPAPYRIIADEREQRNGDSAIISDELPRDGVRRYLGNFGSRLMTTAEAKSIGSHIPNSKDDGEMLETIFVAVASYRDWQCSSTVESAFSRASHPERVRVAVVDQIRLGEDSPCSIPPDGPCDSNPNQATCKHSSQIDYFTVDADLSVGPVFARHLGHRLYRGEYFAMQSDAHVSFVMGWDNEIVEQWHSAKNEMAILSTYLSGVENHIDLTTGKRTSKSRPIMCESDFEGQGAYKHLRHGQQPEGVPYLHEPVLDPFWAAGFSFGRGHFVVNIPYDQHLPWIFQGEEISIGLRGFSYGYDFYSPEKSVCYHFYGRKDVPMFWENVATYRGSGEYGMNRLNAIINMMPPSTDGNTKDWIRTDELKYGIGKVRRLQRFFDVFGIHVKRQTVEKHLCLFVGRPMQKEFIPFLRKNGMGLDYDRITFRFVDNQKIGK